jgi:hypothetical protein
MLKRLFTVLFGASAVVSLATNKQPSEGGLYVSLHKNGKFSPFKILKLDKHGVHLQTYSNVYPTVPSSIDESTLYMAGIDKREDEPLGMGHLPISKDSFSSWGAVFVQQSSVVDEELEGYQIWLEVEGGYF